MGGGGGREGGRERREEEEGERDRERGGREGEREVGGRERGIERGGRERGEIVHSKWSESDSPQLFVACSTENGSGDKTRLWNGRTLTAFVFQSNLFLSLS